MAAASNNKYQRMASSDSDDSSDGLVLDVPPRVYTLETKAVQQWLHNRSGKQLQFEFESRGMLPHDALCVVEVGQGIDALMIHAQCARCKSEYCFSNPDDVRVVATHANIARGFSVTYCGKFKLCGKRRAFECRFTGRWIRASSAAAAAAASEEPCTAVVAAVVRGTPVPAFEMLEANLRLLARDGIRSDDDPWNTIQYVRCATPVYLN
jgi:hypothetical protein